MRGFTIRIIPILMVACLAACAPKVDRPTTVATINQIMNNWHIAAAQAGREQYIGAMAQGGVFMGTDATERWTTREFDAFVTPYFEADNGWLYEPSDRHVVLSGDGQTAWLDERLSSTAYGDLRGTGVLVLEDGAWHIAHYSMTFTLPNHVTAQVVKLIRATAMEPHLKHVLPAGTYFGPHTQAAVCNGCTSPTFAVIAGVFEDTAMAKKALRPLRTLPLRGGYPMVAHTDEISPVDDTVDGIAIILGLFETRDQAETFTGALGEFVENLNIMELLDRDKAADRSYKRATEEGRDNPVPTRIVRIQDGPPVSAFSSEAIEKHQRSSGVSESTQPDTAPVCELAPGELFAVKDETFNHMYYKYAPVTCPGGVSAFVPWQSTLLDTSVKTGENGLSILRQVVGAGFDSHQILEWTYNEKGKWAPTTE